MDFSRCPPPGYELQSRDSTYWAEDLQFEYWRSLDVAAKVGLLEAWAAEVHELQIEGIRTEHPDASPVELERLAAEIRYGREFVSAFLALRAVETTPS